MGRRDHENPARPALLQYPVRPELNTLNAKDPSLENRMTIQNAQRLLAAAMVLLLTAGAARAQNQPADVLSQDEDVREFYLGLREEGAASFRDVKHYKRRKRWLS